MAEKKTAEQILKAQYKRQNEHIKEKYDRVSIALPKDTKDRINALKKSLNAFIVGATLKALDQCEKGADGPQDQEPQQSTENTQKSPVSWDHLADLEKQKAEQTQADAEKTRVFNPQDYK